MVIVYCWSKDCCSLSLNPSNHESAKFSLPVSRLFLVAMVLQVLLAWSFTLLFHLACWFSRYNLWDMKTNHFFRKSKCLGLARENIIPFYSLGVANYAQTEGVSIWNWMGVSWCRGSFCWLVVSVVVCQEIWPGIVDCISELLSIFLACRLHITYVTA